MPTRARDYEIGEGTLELARRWRHCGYWTSLKENTTEKDGGGVWVDQHESIQCNMGSAEELESRGRRHYVLPGGWCYRKVE